MPKVTNRPNGFSHFRGRNEAFHKLRFPTGFVKMGHNLGTQSDKPEVHRMPYKDNCMLYVQPAVRGMARHAPSVSNDRLLDGNALSATKGSIHQSPTSPMQFNAENDPEHYAIFQP